MEEWFQTKTTSRGVMLKELRRLIHLKLEEGVTASKFLSEWKDCCLKLSSVQTTFLNEPMLSAILYSAIQDENYNSVADRIAADNLATVTDILKDIRIREEQLLHKEWNNSGNNITKSARRTNRLDSNNKSTTDGKSSSKKDTNTQSVPFVPSFPKSWPQGYPYDLWKLMRDWRHAVNSQKHDANYLDRTFYVPPIKSAKVPTKDNTKRSYDDAKTKHPKSGTNDSRTRFRSSRRTKSDKQDNSVTDGEIDQSDSSQDAKRPPSNKRIQLGYRANSSSRRVAFERGA